MAEAATEQSSHGLNGGGQHERRKEHERSRDKERERSRSHRDRDPQRDGKSSGRDRRESKSANGARPEEDTRRRRAPPGPNATAEERARYELERKKVAKYKEDKLKARRDHTRMILESHAQAKRRALLGKQSEFLVNLGFRNNLPDLPFDTKFLQYPHERERLIKYKPNSLEMDYTFEIHEEANLGLKIDLIDPAKYEAPEVPEALEIGDEAVLMMKERSAKEGKSKKPLSVSWLRRTEYMGNDLYDSVHKFKSEAEIQNELREGTESALAEVVQLSLEDRAEASFKDIKEVVHPFNKKLKPAKVWEVFPDQVLAANKYTILAYDILPSSDVKSKMMLDREKRALLCGVSTKKNQGTEVYQGSILLPSASTDDDAAENSEKFGYYRDYQLSVQSLESRGRDDMQHCVFVFDPESDQFTYADITHRIHLKKTKLVGDEKRRRGAIVHRREYSQGETERRQSVRFEYGGLYDESLDDDDYRREYKRQKRSKEKNSNDEEEKEDPKTVETDNADEVFDKSSGEEDNDETNGNESPKISDGSDSSSDE